MRRTFTYPYERNVSQRTKFRQHAYLPLAEGLLVLGPVLSRISLLVRAFSEK